MSLGLTPISGGAISSAEELTKARASQTVVEVLRTGTAVKAQASQTVLEVLRTGTAVGARASQTVIEVLRANGAEVPIGGTARPVVMVIT